MSDERLIRSELAYWNDDKTSVELYEDYIRFEPVGSKTIEIKYANIASCKRYMKELLVTSKGSSDSGFYDIHYIPLKFENKDVAEYYFSFIAERAQQFADISQTDRDTGKKKDESPIYTIPSRMGFTEGVLYIYDDHFSFRVAGQGENARLHYMDVHEIIKNFGTLRFSYGRNENMTFQIPKAIYAELYNYLDNRIKNMHVHEIESDPDYDRLGRTGIGKQVNDIVIAESDAARGMLDDENRMMSLETGRLKRREGGMPK
ncbi:MAG: hypothetical protein K6G87_15685 [Butyrivibrio sp.]|uniref:hypothetical protein n=1 Tax=Butyrivibrio sp. TaxID=28121 RepID=UPI0025DC7E93|nr:hypothetical protein [Butyrivibrio sp.]MCR5772661.1 hypothetical protein [Butyrivibrio sp.]